MRCPECQAENREGAAFCTECGQALAPVCPGCGASATADDKFCGACGKPLSATAPPVAGAKARKHLEAAAEQCRALDIPATLAMSLHGLGLLASAKMRSADARAHLDEARELAAAVEAEALVDKIDAALAGLA